MFRLKSDHKKTLKTCKTIEKGQAAVEALLVLMILILVIISGIELGRGISLRQALDSSTAAASRVLSLDSGQWEDAANLIQTAVKKNVMGEAPEICLQVYDDSGTLRSSAWLSGSPFGTTFLLEAAAPFQAQIPFLPTSLLQVRVRHWGVVEVYP